MSDDGTSNPARPPLRIAAQAERAVEPAPDATPTEAASELVVQGLLESVHRGDAASREHRIETFFAGLEKPVRKHAISPRRAIKWGLSIAALIAITATLVMIGVPGESSALAEVRQSIQAMRAAGDRRYEVSMVQRSTDDAGADVNAIIDMRSPNLLLIRHKPPGWKDFAVGGRDEKGAWAILKDGSTTRTNPQRQWPPFVTDGGETFMTESIDRQLEELPDLFTFAKAAGEQINGKGEMFDRITATRKVRNGMKPTSVDLWIDPTSHFVERIEYRWEMADATAGGGAGGGPRGDDPRDRGPRDRGGPGGPPPDGGLSNGPPPRGGPHGPDDDHHDHSDHGGPGGPPPHDHDHDRDRADGPGGPRGSGGGGGRGGPRVVVFQRVDAPTLSTSWFSPEGHGGK